VANFCCFDDVIPGKALLESGKLQAERLGAVFIPEDIIDTKNEDDRFALASETGEMFLARTLVLALGVSRKKLKVKGEKEFVGRGVSYCVDCDAGFYRDADVVIVGNESAAVTGALTLLGFAKKVYLVTKGLNVTDTLQERLESSDVTVLEDAWVEEILGDSGVDKIALTNGQELTASGIFIELGAKGAMELAANLGVTFDAETFSFIETNKKQETNIPGLYAAGDITGQPWQIAKAVGEGCIAGLEAAGRAKRLNK
jgi:thioredoxin reductase (NADPH)